MCWKVIYKESDRAYLCVGKELDGEDINAWATQHFEKHPYNRMSGGNTHFWRAWGVTCQCEKHPSFHHVEVNRMTFEQDGYEFHDYDSGPHHPPHVNQRPIMLVHDWYFLAEEGISVYDYRQKHGDNWGFEGLSKEEFFADTTEALEAQRIDDAYRISQLFEDSDRLRAIIDKVIRKHFGIKKKQGSGPCVWCGTSNPCTCGRDPAYRQMITSIVIKSIRKLTKKGLVSSETLS